MRKLKLRRIWWPNLPPFYQPFVPIEAKQCCSVKMTSCTECTIINKMSKLVPVKFPKTPTHQSSPIAAFAGVVTSPMRAATISIAINSTGLITGSFQVVSHPIPSPIIHCRKPSLSLTAIAEIMPSPSSDLAGPRCAERRKFTRTNNSTVIPDRFQSLPASNDVIIE